MTLKIAFLGVVSAALASTAHAQFSPSYNSCIQRAHGDTVQSGMCAQTELTHQDDRLNKAYAKVVGQYPVGDPQRVALRDDERSWLKKRDYDCKINHETIDNGCLVEKTAARADYLEHKIKF